MSDGNVGLNAGNSPASGGKSQLNATHADASDDNLELNAANAEASAGNSGSNAGNSAPNATHAVANAGNSVTNGGNGDANDANSDGNDDNAFHHHDHDGRRDRTRRARAHHIASTNHLPHGGSMQISELKTQDAGERVEVFLDSEATVIGDAVTPALRARLDLAVRQLRDFKAQQAKSQDIAQGSTGSLEAMRTALYDRFMRPIGKFAKAALPDSPVLPTLVVPVMVLNNGRVGDFITAAENMAEVADQNSSALIAVGMATTHVADFRAAIASLNDASKSRNESLGRQVASTAGLAAKVKAVKAVIDNIDAVLRPVLKANPDLRARWLSSKRVVKVPATPIPTGNDDGPTTPPATTPAQPVTPTAPVLTIADGNQAAA